jgi:maltooligosyltrehalose trehalohydrolase
MTRVGARLGAHAEPGGVRFGAFTEHESCAVRLVSATGDVLREVALEPLGDGYFEVTVPDVEHGDLYWFVIGGRALPDPFARYLPQGVHGPAMVVVPRYAAQHLPPARPLSRQVLYELHIGTFTEAGTFAAASARLRALAELGVTTLQLMPVAAFAGQRGWGYDGVALLATHAAYGTPDELRELIDTAHGLGLSVLLDVVYNHFGPAGHYLPGARRPTSRSRRCASWCSTARATGYEKSASTACAWMPRTRSSIPRPSTS